MAQKARLANRTIWTLEDIIAISQLARRACFKVHAKAGGDSAMLRALGEIMYQLAEIEALARDGREGKYNAKPVKST